jgi:hypothetical protein
MSEIPLKGNIKNFRLPEIFIYLHRNKKTGTLSVKTPLFTKEVYFIKGEAIFSSSTYEDDRLGEMLVKAGKITMKQYDTSVKLLKKTGKRQGSILVELGYLTPKKLFWGVKYQVREIIYSLFRIEDAEYIFKAGKVPIQEAITLKMSVGDLVYEGVKRIDNWTRIRNEMPDTETVIQLRSDPLHLFQDVELGSQDKKILSKVNGKRTIKDIINSSRISSFGAMKTLYALWSTGIIEEKKKETAKC